MDSVTLARLYIVSVLLLVWRPARGDTHNCIPDSECESQDIQCQAGEDCFVECGGTWSCREATVLCPEDNECHVKCFYNEEAYDEMSNYTSYLTCYGMTIRAASSSLLTVEGAFGDLDESDYIRTAKSTPGRRYARTLEAANIYCPRESAHNRACRFSCDGDSLMRSMSIYAEQGVNDLRIESEGYTGVCMRSNTLHCGSALSLNCPLSTQPPWDCQDVINSAPDTTCEFPTTSPTPAPSYVPSYSPTGQPSSSPIDTVVAPTASPMEAVAESSTTAGDELRVLDPRSDGMSEMELVLAILVPVLCCACCCIGLGVFWYHRSEESSSAYQKTRGNDEEYDQDDGEPAGTLMTTMTSHTEEEEAEDEDDDDDDDVNTNVLPFGGVTVSVEDDCPAVEHVSYDGGDVDQEPFDL